jgi:hypothetical protein
MTLAYSVVEAMAHPGYSVVDGYWIGRLPWTGIFEALVVGGATASTVVGALTVLAFGGWPRRLLVVVPVALTGLWWFFAYARAGVSGGACPGCQPPAFDPWAYAYSAPMLALETLIVPALATALLALTIGPARSEEAGYISPS